MWPILSVSQNETSGMFRSLLNIKVCELVLPANRANNFYSNLLVSMFVFPLMYFGTGPYFVSCSIWTHLSTYTLFVSTGKINVQVVRGSVQVDLRLYHWEECARLEKRFGITVISLKLALRQQQWPRDDSNKRFLTINDVTQALGEEEIFQTRHLLLQLADQSVVGILVDDGVAANLFGAVCVPVCVREASLSDIVHIHTAAASGERCLTCEIMQAAVENVYYVTLCPSKPHSSAVWEGADAAEKMCWCLCPTWACWASRRSWCQLDSEQQSSQYENYPLTQHRIIQILACHRESIAYVNEGAASFWGCIWRAIASLRRN